MTTEHTLRTFSLTDEQQQISRLLEQLLGPAIASRYVDFCRIVDPGIELLVTRPIAAHAVREIESIIRASLELPLDAGRTEVEDPRKVRATNALLALGYEREVISAAVTKLAPRITHANQIQTIAKRLGFDEHSSLTTTWVRLNKLAGKAHERTFHRALEIDDDFRDNIQRAFDFVLRHVLTALQKNYSAMMIRVEAIASMTNYGEAVTCFKREIPSALPLQWHFFQRITAPGWLPLLLDHGLTGEPLETLSALGNRTFRQWPVGIYLLTLAKSSDRQAHTNVVSALRKVASSRHPDVRAQGLQVIAALPPAVARDLVDLAIGWLNPEEFNFYSNAPHELIALLAQADFGAEAIRLAEAVFAVVDSNGSIGSLHPHAMYEHHLQELAPKLIAVSGFGALNLFAGLLLRTETIARRFGEKPEQDFTYITPHALSESQMATYGIAEGLTIAVRNAALSICLANSEQAETIIHALVERRARLFHRIALHVASRHAAAIPALTATMLKDRQYVGELWCEEEYAELARARFLTLPPEEQDIILAIIDSLPAAARDGWIERFTEYEKRPPTAKDHRAFDASVIRDAVWKWREALPTDRQQALGETVEEFGSPDDWQTRIFREEKSPLTASELAALHDNALIRYLAEWKPNLDGDQHSISALASELQVVISKDMPRFARLATRFAPLRLIYVRRLLEGFDTALRSGEKFSDWTSILDLCGAAVGNLSGLALVLDGDPKKETIAVAKAAAHVLKSGLGQGASAVPYELAPAILSVIQSLCTAAPRTLDTAEPEFWRHPYFSSEQSLWGSTVELSILFVFWSSKFPESPVFHDQRNALQLIPEIRTLLDDALKDKTESGPIPRAIIGRFLNWLVWFGESWLRESCASIFPAHEPALRRAAWLGHLLNDSGPAKAVIECLLPSYLAEIDELNSCEAVEREEHRAHRLGDYIMVLILTDHAPDALLSAFFSQAADRARSHALFFLGRELALPPEKLPDHIRARGMAYLENRIAVAVADVNPARFQNELGGIGQWCGKPQIDPAWLLAQMQKMLKSGLAPLSGYLVTDWLAKVADTYPSQSVDVLILILENPNCDRSSYMVRSEAIAKVLELGLTSGIPQTAKRAQEAISLLSTMGKSSYLSLLARSAIPNLNVLPDFPV